RVVTLQERIQELVEPDGGPLPVTLLEVIALEHAGHGHLGGEPDRVLGAQAAEPCAVAAHLGPPGVADAKDRILVGACVHRHLGGQTSPRSRTRRTLCARPLVSSTSITAPWTRTGPAATSKRTGIWVRKRSSTCSVRTPSTESSGPHMPASVRCAVPPGRIASSAVWTWV